MGAGTCLSSQGHNPWPRSELTPAVHLQVSVPVRLPALGLSVLQLQLGLDGPRTLPSSVRVYLYGRQLSVSRHEAFPIRVIDSGTSDFALSNRYMQVWFSGLTGLLKVKGQGLGAGGQLACRGVVPSCLPTDGGPGSGPSWPQADSTGKLGLTPWGILSTPSQGAGLTCWRGARGQGCVFWQSIQRVDEEQERRVDTEFLIYGTRTSKDKSGAYLFLPDGEAKVLSRHPACPSHPQGGGQVAEDCHLGA